MTLSRRGHLLPLVTFCALMLSSTAFTQDAGSQAKKADATAKEVADLKQALTTTQKDLDATKKQLDAAVKAVEAASKAVASAQATAVTKDSLTAIRADINALKSAPPPKFGMSDEDKKAVSDAADAATNAASAASSANQRGNTAWMLTAAAFVMFMVPGLALFYAGMVRRKNVLATMMQSMAALAVVGVYWLAVGYGLAFGPSLFRIDLLGIENGGFIGWSSDLFFLQGVEATDYLPAYSIPVYLHVMFQGMFAILTPALISGAIAERIRFWPFCIFMILWITLVYCPLAHMVWAFDWYDTSVPLDKRGLTAIGLLGKLGALDFAGGTVVHIAAGVAGLACSLVLRKRDGYPKTVTHPNSMVLTLLGAGFLWFGWFGFNGGSFLDASSVGVSAFAATQAAAASAGLAWMAIEWLHKGKPTALGLASGIVAGLVAITPASGFVYAWGALAIGVAAAAVCYLAVYVKGLLGYDDSLDAFGVHGVGGFVGAVLTGFFAYNAVNPVVTPGTGGNDGFFAVRGAAHAAKLKEAEDKLSAQEKAQALSADTDEAKAALSDPQKTYKSLKGVSENGVWAQPWIQFKAAMFSTVYAFVLSLGLCLLVQAITLGNFSTSKKDETIGLDQTEHGETGFDFGYATQSVHVVDSAEPRAATAPKGNGRFSLGVEGVPAEELRRQWTALCQPSDQPSDPDFLAVYPHITTLTGTTFRARGDNPPGVASRLEALLKKLMPGKMVSVTRI